MKTNIYQFKDYKEYINFILDSVSNGARGQRKKLADAIASQVSHISNVLSGPGHFSQEQAEAVARFLGLDFGETEFLLLLIQENRAGTKSLREFYRKLLNERRAKNERLKSTLEFHDELTPVQQSTYYSSWHFSAIHVLLSIPGFNTREAIAKRLYLPLPTVDHVLQYLVEAGLCEKIGLSYRQRRPLLHLDRESPHVTRHHANWRHHAIHTPQFSSPDSLRYSGVISLAHDDVQKVRNIFSGALANAMDVIKVSKEEELTVLNIDYYRF